MKIVVVGSVALDSIKTPFGEVEEILGGSATHFALAASFFTKVGVVAVVGSDFPESYWQFFAEHEIDTTGLTTQPGKTFRWRGYYEYDLNQAHTLETQLNVFENFQPLLPEAYKAVDYLFLANIDPSLQLNVLSQVTAPKLIVSDTMNFWINLKPEELKKVISLVDFCFMNEGEARQFCQTYSLTNSARQLLSLGPKAVILKKGEHGALLFTDSTHFSAPAFPIEEIKDPTGAGDSFAGGFIGWLAQTNDLSEANIRKAIIYGSVMASFSVEGFGTERLKLLSRQEIEERYQFFQEITRF